MSRAMIKYESDVAVERVKYERALAQFKVNPKSGPAQNELAQYYSLTGKLTGVDITLAEVEAIQVSSLRRKYEQATGYKFGSQELEAAIDRTIEHM